MPAAAIADGAGWTGLALRESWWTGLAVWDFEFPVTAFSGVAARVEEEEACSAACPDVLGLEGWGLQGYLAHKNHSPPKTLP